MTPAGVRRLTPEGSGGVAVLLVTGAPSIEQLRRGFSRRLPEPGAIALGTLAAEGATGEAETLDEVVLLALPGGDAFEVHAHGSPFVTGEIIRVLGGSAGEHGAQGRLSFEERARRSAHAVPTGLGARILLDQSMGALRRELDSVAALAPAERAPALMALAAAGRDRERLFRETTLVLRGPVNAGKSTLFNVLVGAEAAVTSSVEGTTRDALMERARIGPWPVRLIDTAGERDLRERVGAGDQRAEVEGQGQRLAEELAARADLVLEVAPVGDDERRSLSPPEPQAAQSVVIRTQAATRLGGLPEEWGPGVVSALEAPAHAREAVLGALCRELRLAKTDDELWSPGLAVPFDQRSILALEEAAAHDVTDTVLDDLARNL